jgi:hypothetical protein
LLTRKDAEEVLERRDALEFLVAGHLWNEVLPNVLAPAAAQPDLECAAMLWDQACILSHCSAARHHGIWVPDCDQVHVCLSFKNGHREAEGLTIHRSRHFDRCWVGDSFRRWTYPGRTLVDLSQKLSRAQLEASLLSGVRAKVVSAADVVEAAKGLHTRPGVTTLLEIAGLWTPERETLLEDRLYGDVCSVVDPSTVSRQLVVPKPDGSVGARIDVAIEELRLAFEGDGLFWHSTDAQIAKDQSRDRWMLTQGWQTVRFREGVLDDRSGVRRDVRQIVDRRRFERRWAA